MTTRNGVTLFILFIVGIMIGRCSAPAPHPPGHIDVAELKQNARQCLYNNLPSIHTDRAFEFVADDCQQNGGLTH